MKLKILVILLVAGILILGGYYAGWDYFVRQINEDCSEDYSLGVFTPVRNISTGKCEIFPNSCIPVGFVADAGCADEWQRFHEVEREISTDQQSQTDIFTWQTYRNEKYGFEVKYPKEWSFGDNLDGVGQVVRLSGPGNNSVSIEKCSRMKDAEDACYADDVISKLNAITISGRSAFKGSMQNNGQESIYIPFNNYYLILTSWINDKQSNHISDQILSTFKFLK